MAANNYGGYKLVPPATWNQSPFLSVQPITAGKGKSTGSVFAGNGIRRFVITAAHCVTEMYRRNVYFIDKKSIKLHLPKLDATDNSIIYGENGSPTFDKYPVVAAVMHPSFPSIANRLMNKSKDTWTEDERREYVGADFALLWLANTVPASYGHLFTAQATETNTGMYASAYGFPEDTVALHSATGKVALNSSPNMIAVDFQGIQGASGGPMMINQAQPKNLDMFYLHGVCSGPWWGAGKAKQQTLFSRITEEKLDLLQRWTSNKFTCSSDCLTKSSFDNLGILSRSELANTYSLKKEYQSPEPLPSTPTQATRKTTAAKEKKATGTMTKKAKSVKGKKKK